jgi:hypothetical protein
MPSAPESQAAPAFNASRTQPVLALRQSLHVASEGTPPLLPEVGHETAEWLLTRVEHILLGALRGSTPCLERIDGVLAIAFSNDFAKWA